MSSSTVLEYTGFYDGKNGTKPYRYLGRVTQPQPLSGEQLQDISDKSKDKIIKLSEILNKPMKELLDCSESKYFTIRLEARQMLNHTLETKAGMALLSEKEYTIFNSNNVFIGQLIPFSIKTGSREEMKQYFSEMINKYCGNTIDISKILDTTERKVFLTLQTIV